MGTLTDAQAGQITGALADLRKSAAQHAAKQGFSESAVKSVSRFLDNLVNVLQKTVKTKKTDVALSLMLDSAAATLLAAQRSPTAPSWIRACDNWPMPCKRMKKPPHGSKLVPRPIETSHCTRFPCPPQFAN